ncbi:MobC family plasmid mobilization relaxosome protein, partial [Pantoea stewartii]|uniref:MobC family plasmid mobilization relaxosome protein n=1 Tax=Pantoea stewartii TaxID=66269 RepID=UPI003DA77279
FPPVPALSGAGLADKRKQMLTMWVTEDEHRRLLERCDGKRLAAVRQTCLDEKPARAVNFHLDLAGCFVQLAGMGNNLNQIARQANAGGGSESTAYRLSLRWIAIDAGLGSVLGTRCWKGLTMIVKFHPRGRGSGAGPVDYLLGKDCQSATAPPFCRGKPDSPGSLSTPSPYMQKIHLRRAVFFRTGLTARPA